jgi:hypothetical protein
MIRTQRLTAWLAVVGLSASVAVSEQRPSNTEAVSEEPFRSFRILDAKLTVLTNEQEALKAASNPMNADSESIAVRTQRRKKASRAMNFAATEIERIAGGLELLYERRHQSFGVQMFKIMRVKAEEVRLGVNAVGKAQTRSALNLATRRLDERILSLVAQFQAASGGYGATRCSLGAWTCCEPKRSKDSPQSEHAACMWVCIPRPASCTGFIGPRIRGQP